jgi:hypothetical protein
MRAAAVAVTVVADVTVPSIRVLLRTIEVEMSLSVIALGGGDGVVFVVDWPSVAIVFLTTSMRATCKICGV